MSTQSYADFKLFHVIPVRFPFHGTVIDGEGAKGAPREASWMEILWNCTDFLRTENPFTHLRLFEQQGDSPPLIEAPS